MTWNAGAAGRSSSAEWGVAKVALERQARSGDKCLVRPGKGGVLMAVADGLGHGSEAAAAAEIAMETLGERAEEPVLSLVERCHEALKGTRGVALTVASLNAAEGTLTWVAVGNVEGVILRSDAGANPRKVGVVTYGGLVGYRLPTLRAAAVPLQPGDTVIMATDGISSGFADGVSPDRAPQEIADDILSRCRKSTDDALVLVMRYLQPGR